jgi:toxin ParE1/3/4
VAQKLKWTKRAHADLSGIYEFIARDSKQYAQVQTEDVQNAVLKLSKFPIIGHYLSEFPHLPYREILVDN